MDKFPRFYEFFMSLVFRVSYFNVEMWQQREKSKYELNKQTVQNHRGKYRNVYSWFNFSRTLNGLKWHPCTLLSFENGIAHCIQWHRPMFVYFHFYLFVFFHLENTKCFLFVFCLLWIGKHACQRHQMIFKTCHCLHLFSNCTANMCPLGLFFD